MKKKFLGIAAVAAALTLSTGMTAFAGWVQNDTGWFYVYPDGYSASMGWFTDPDTGLEYYINPDGYMMTETRVEGYWLDDKGVKREKTEEELKREQEKEKKESKKPNPNREQQRATQAAKDAVSATSAVKTNRLGYQAEMKVFANKALQNAWKNMSLEEENDDLRKDIKETSVETTYKINQKDGNTLISTSLWLMSNPKNVDYKDEAFSLTYIPNHIRTASQGTEVKEAFHMLSVAALGETEGETVFNELTSQMDASAEKYNRTGLTDTGNSYTINYRYGIVNLDVICSGVDPEAEADRAVWAEEKAAKERAANTVVEETTSSVITVGKNESIEQFSNETEASEETTTSEEEDASEETDASESDNTQADDSQ